MKKIKFSTKVIGEDEAQTGPVVEDTGIGTFRIQFYYKYTGKGVSRQMQEETILEKERFDDIGSLDEIIDLDKAIRQHIAEFRKAKGQKSKYNTSYKIRGHFLDHLDM